MSTSPTRPPETKLPDDYPGKTAVFPPEVSQLVYAIFGIQARDAGDSGVLVAELACHLERKSGPDAFERLRYVDPTGAHCEIFLAYWSDPEIYRIWFGQPAVREWWSALHLHCGPDVGLWLEEMTPHKDYYQYGAGVPQTGGLATLGSLVPCDKFGYWGGYRDRVPASVHDKFEPSMAKLSEPRSHDTLGKRLTVHTPDNICFIREGQGWDRAGIEEREVWQQKMESVVDRWISELRDRPVETGCLSLRACREHAPETGVPLEKQSQIAFLLSLKHIERAARATHSHLQVKSSFTQMYNEPRFEPKMHIWVEMLILKSGDLRTEYINCHPLTGLLPYFEPQEAAVA